MPALGLERSLGPPGVPAAVAQPDHGPPPGQRRAALPEQVQPRALAGVLGGGRQDLPGHRHGAAAVPDALGQGREALAPGGGLPGEGPLPAGPAGPHPASPGGEAGPHVEFLPRRQGLGAGRAVPIAQALLDGVELLANLLGPLDGSGRDRAAVRQHPAEAEPGQATDRGAGEGGKALVRTASQEDRWGRRDRAILRQAEPLHTRLRIRRKQGSPFFFRTQTSNLPQ